MLNIMPDFFLGAAFSTIFVPISIALGRFSKSFFLAWFGRGTFRPFAAKAVKWGRGLKSRFFLESCLLHKLLWWRFGLGSKTKRFVCLLGFPKIVFVGCLGGPAEGLEFFLLIWGAWAGAFQMIPILGVACFVDMAGDFLAAPYSCESF